MILTAILGAVLAAAAGTFFILNPLIFGFNTGVPHESFFVYEKHFILDGELASVRKSFEDENDFNRYRNHCLRVLTFTKFFMPDFVLKEYGNVMNIVAMALAFHDVALWTDGELNYLEPSFKQMEFHVRKEGLFEEEHIDIARQIIMEHHKIFDYKGGQTDAINAIVNAVRKADWTDFTIGIIRFGLPAALLEAAYTKVEEGGFHMMLAGFGKRLSPNSMIGQLEVLRIFKL